MTKEQYNNQPAFPVDELNQQTGFVEVQHLGITTRDYFAAKAMQGGLCEGSEVYRPSEFAKWCYEMADAMLKARNLQ